MALTYCKDLHLALSLRLAVNAFVQLNAAKLHIQAHCVILYPATSTQSLIYCPHYLYSLQMQLRRRQIASFFSFEDTSARTFQCWQNNISQATINLSIHVSDPLSLRYLLHFSCVFFNVLQHLIQLIPGNQKNALDRL